MGVGPREIFAAGVTLGRGQLARYGGSGTSATKQFEHELAAHVGVSHVLAVNTGTSALTCCLVGLGIGPGDEVLVPGYTFVASAASVIGAGAVPVVVEVDESLTIDPADIVRKITPKTKAIMPVHMLNMVCDMDAIMAIAAEHDLAVVEDAAQSAGVTYHGRQTASIGHAGAFSFNQQKNLKSGEGGAVFTDDARLYTRASMFHDVGNYLRGEDSVHDEPLFAGYNLRMSELTSSMLRPQLARLDRMMATRRKRFEHMTELLDGCPHVRPVTHHDPAAAVGLAVLCESAEHARIFGATKGVTHLYETGRHVYTNWDPIWVRRTHHPVIDPYRWAYGDDPVPEVDCPRTLEILQRACGITLDPEIPGPVFKRLAQRIAEAANELGDVVSPAPTDADLLAS